jgi:hypothetical protein
MALRELWFYFAASSVPVAFFLKQKCMEKLKKEGPSNFNIIPFKISGPRKKWIDKIM